MNRVSACLNCKSPPGQVLLKLLAVNYKECWEMMPQFVTGSLWSVRDLPVKALQICVYLDPRGRPRKTV